MADEMDGRLQEVERSLTTLESQVREQLGRAQSGTRTMLVIGIILIAIIFTYLTYLTSLFKPYADPKALAEVLQGTVSDRIPAVKAVVENAAPEIVGSLRKRLNVAIPDLSKRAEAKAMAFMDDQLEKLAKGTEDLVAKMLTPEHISALKPLVQAATKPGGAEALKKEFTKELEELIGWKLDEVLRNFDGTLDLVSRQLDHLNLPDKQLTPDDRLWKEAVSDLMMFLDQTFTMPPPTPPAPKGK